MKFRVIKQTESGTQLTGVKELERPIFWAEMEDGEWVNIGPSHGCSTYEHAIDCCAERAYQDTKHSLEKEAGFLDSDG